MNIVKHSYSKDCIFLLKDLSNVLKEVTIEEKENVIRNGGSYSEVISKEDTPTEEAMKIFREMMDNSGADLAYYVAKISQQMYSLKGRDLIIISLARGGTPYGILVRRYIKYKYKIDIPHYSISIIRGKGIDYNALQYIYDKHKNCNVQFVDGWTGKGSIIKELNKSIDIFNKKNNSSIDASLAVIADPARLCSIYGTRDDITIPSCCLNGTISGLISRTVLNDKLISRKDFHGAKFLEYLTNHDISQQYIDEIANNFNMEDIKIIEEDQTDYEYSEKIVEEIKTKYNMKSINSIKLSIGESTRVLLRRKPKLILVKDIEDPQLRNIIYLAKERNVKVKEYAKSNYNAIALIDEGI